MKIKYYVAQNKQSDPGFTSSRYPVSVSSTNIALRLEILNLIH